MGRPRVLEAVAASTALGASGCRVHLAAVLAGTFLATASAFQVSDPGMVPRGIRLCSRTHVNQNRPHMQLVDPVVTNMIIGAASGSMSNMAVFPFELAKTRMQNAKNKGEKEQYSNLIASIATITKDGGISALWAGSIPVLIGGAPESALQLAAHSWIVSTMIMLVGAPGTCEADLPFVCQLLAGAFAGVATLGATNPMEVLRLKAAGGDERGLLAQVKDLGLGGLFQGYEATLLRDLPFSTMYFPLYCHLKVEAEPILESLHVANHATAALIIAGLGAGAVASFVTTPFDTIKTRIQSQQRPPHGPTSDIAAAPDQATTTPARLVTAFASKTRVQEGLPAGIDGIKTVALEMVASEGWASFMTGAGVRVAKLGPNMALTLALYETAQRLVSVL